jgi:glycosyltransferase involved in cell wall biosynthesis
LDLRAFERFAADSMAVDFLLVNDGSSDTTLEMLEALHQRNPARFGFLHLGQNSGKAEAVRQGLLSAIADGAPLVGFWDADLATPLAEIPRFCGLLDEHPELEMVVGSRLSLLGRRIDRHPARQFLGRLFSATASLALGMRMADTQCGAKLFRVTPQFKQIISEPFAARWIFDVEILARLILARRDTSLPLVRHIIYECPLENWRDVAGSKLQTGDFFKAAGELARIYWTYLRPSAELPDFMRRKPLVVPLPQAVAEPVGARRAA